MAEETPDEIFDKVSDNFKKICTKDGIDELAVIDFIINISKLLPDEKKVTFAEEICFQTTLQCANNYYETLGILESAKLRYHDAFNFIIDESSTEDEEDED